MPRIQIHRVFVFLWKQDKNVSVMSRLKAEMCPKVSASGRCQQFWGLDPPKKLTFFAPNEWWINCDKFRTKSDFNSFFKLTYFSVACPVTEASMPVFPHRAKPNAALRSSTSQCIYYYLHFSCLLLPTFLLLRRRNKTFQQPSLRCLGLRWITVRLRHCSAKCLGGFSISCES